MAKQKKRPGQKTDTIQPTYVNLPMANQLSQRYPDGSLPANPRPATKGDSIEYKQGFNYGRTGGKQGPGESEFFKMGRWEGQKLYNPPSDQESSFVNKAAAKLRDLFGGDN